MKKTLLILAGLSFSEFASAQWTSVSTAITGKLETVVFTSPTDGFTAGAFQYIYKTTNGGTSWSSAGNYDAKDLYFFDANNGYAAGVAGTGTMKNTTNAGGTWTNLTPPNSSSIWGTFATSASTCYFIATDKKVHKSVNSGGSFVSTTLTVTFSLTDIWFTDANNGYVTSQDGIIFKTTNAGSTWTTNFTAAAGTQLNAIYFVNTNLGFACGTNGTVLRTTNAGTSWTALTTGTSFPLNAVRFFDAINGVAVGYGGTIIHTTNGGTTWSTDVSNTTKWLYSIAYTGSPSSIIVVGDSGAVLKNTNEPSGINNQQAISSNAINCFPNPANDFTMLTIMSNDNQKVSPEIYDMNGACVKLLGEMELTRGENEIQLDLADLPSGIYFLRLNCEGTILEKKISVIR
jgi:photosystem II stability/assembly factor-like uncharacterized protein